MALTGRDIIVVGTSAGGVTALQRLLGGLAPDLPAAVFVVIHIGAGMDSAMATVLQRSSRLPVAEATDGARIERGKVFVAPADCHLFVERDRIAVLRGPKENRTRPAINPLFRSAAAAYRNRVAGVILTGTMDDGVAGLWAIKQCGGIAVVQSDPQFEGMARSALENVEVDHHVTLDEIPRLLHRLARETVEAAPENLVPEVIQLSDQSTKMEEAGFPFDDVGRRSLFTCPDCHGTLWEMEQGALEYRCHVGHAYAPGMLLAAQEARIEETLWGALRALKESAALDERVADRAAEHKLHSAAASHRTNAHAKLKQVATLQQFLATLGRQEESKSKKLS